jgi:hypothetical protein
MVRKTCGDIRGERTPVRGEEYRKSVPFMQNTDAILTEEASIHTEKMSLYVRFPRTYNQYESKWSHLKMSLQVGIKKLAFIIYIFEVSSPKCETCGALPIVQETISCVLPSLAFTGHHSQVWMSINRHVNSLIGSNWRYRPFVGVADARAIYYPFHVIIKVDTIPCSHVSNARSETDRSFSA